MNGAEIILAVVIASLLAAVFYLSHRLVRTNNAMTGFAAKCLEHALGWSEDQRSLMRQRLELEQAEVLLRERRDAEALRRGRPVEVPRANGTAPHDIRVATTPGIVAD